MPAKPNTTNEYESVMPLAGSDPDLPFDEKWLRRYRRIAGQRQYTLTLKELCWFGYAALMSGIAIGWLIALLAGFHR